MGLETPPEPKDLRRLASDVVKSGLSPRNVLWLGNRLPKYLWSYWGDELKKQGVRWQDFLKVLSELNDVIEGWALGSVEWGELVERVRESLKSVRGAAEVSERAGLTRWFKDF